MLTRLKEATNFYKYCPVANSKQESTERVWSEIKSEKPIAELSYRECPFDEIDNSCDPRFELFMNVKPAITSKPNRKNAGMNYEVHIRQFSYRKRYFIEIRKLLRISTE